MDRETEAAPLHAGEDAAASSEGAKPAPPRDAFRASYDTAIRGIEAQRGTQQFENRFHQQIAGAVFDGCYGALEHYAAWRDERGQADKASHHELREVRLGTGRNTVSPRLNVVSAPMGTGKTTFTTAFIVAMVRLSDADPHMPYGCLFLTDQIVKADAMFREVSAFLPGKVAIWTSDHDVDCPQPS